MEDVGDPAEAAGCVSRVAEGDSGSHPPIAIERSRASSSADTNEGFFAHQIILPTVSCLLMLMIGTLGLLEFLNLPICRPSRRVT